MRLFALPKSINPVAFQCASNEIIRFSACIIATNWSVDFDSDFSDLTYPGGCFENESSKNWKAWNCEIVASVIINGELITGTAHMGGNWIPSDKHPKNVIPTVNGYESQMISDALNDLLSTNIIDCAIAYAQITLAKSKL